MNDPDLEELAGELSAKALEAQVEPEVHEGDMT